MLGEKNSTFGAHLLASERELFNERSNELIRNGSVVTSVYFVLQLYLGSGTIKPITHLVVVTTLLINAISYLLANKFNYNWIVLFTFLPVLLVPIYIDPYVERGWISYGLIIAVFVITASSIESEVFALTLVIFGVICQYVVARRMEVAPSTAKQYIDRAKQKYRVAGINLRTKTEIYKVLRDEGLVN